MIGSFLLSPITHHLSPFNLSIQIISHLLHVFPSLALLGRVAQEIGRMKCGHDLDASVVLKITAQFGDALFGVEQILHRCVAEHDDYVGLDDGDFAQEKRLAGLRFICRRLAILRRATAIDVADHYVLAFQADGLDNLIQQLPGTTYKWATLSVFVRTRRFADEHQASLAIAFAIDDVRAPLTTQRAAHAFAYVV